MERANGREGEEGREEGTSRRVFVFAWVGAYIQRPGTSPPLSRDDEAIPSLFLSPLVSGSGLFFCNAMRCDATRCNPLIGTLEHELRLHTRRTYIYRIYLSR